MKRNLVKAAVLWAVVCSLALPASETIFSSTIDFLDYCFAPVVGGRKGTEPMPLEEYDAILKEVAETGVKKVYLRVNVRGVTLYPSQVVPMYGEERRRHFNKESVALAATIRNYDACAETIRIGHKYGMEVWAWESLWEDGGLKRMWRPPTDPKELEYYYKYEGDPMNDPYFLEHPDGLARLDPKLVPSEEEAARINREARGRTIGRIVMTDHVKGRKPLRINKDDIAIYTSKDNRNWTEYTGGFDFAASVTPEGFNRIELSGLAIKDAIYVRLKLKRAFSTAGGDVTMASSKNDRRNQHLVYDTDGKRIAAFWAVDEQGDRRLMPLVFTPTTAEGWDFGGRGMGFIVGEPPPEQDIWWGGICEYAVPATRAHKLARFAELAKYPFDGFIFNLRSHSRMPDPTQYGYNKENRDEYLKRYGVDIWKEQADLDKLTAIRMEAVALFLKECRQRTDGRPLYLSGLPPHDWTPPAGAKPLCLGMYVSHVHLQLPYRQLLADKSIDGIIMAGYDFSDYIRALPGGKDVKLGLFRELAHLNREKPAAPAGYDFRKDIEAAAANPGLDEVELYETMIINTHPRVREIVRQAARKAASYNNNK